MSSAIEAQRQKLQHLQAQHASGAIGAEAFAEERSRLEAALVAAVMQGSTPAGSAAVAARAAPSDDSIAPRASRRLQLGLVAAIVLLAVVGYAFTGSPDRARLGPAATRTEATAAVPGGDGGQAVTAEQMAEIVDRIAQRLKEKPDDVTGWTLLARAYSAMGRYAEAEPAYRKALKLGGENATLLADFADVLAAQNNGKLGDEGLKMVDRALVLEPDNIKALALAGSAAFDNRDYAAAVRQWERVEALLPAASPFLVEVRASIAQARALGGMPAAAVANAPVTPAAPPVAAAASTVIAAKAGAISGTVSLDAKLAAQANPNDTVFILARAAEGSRMPLAVLRKQVKDLPFTFVLDDSMAMAPNAKLSDHARVVVSARVSKSGDAMPRPGDLRGQASEVAPGASGIAIRIAEVVGQ